MLKSEGTGVRKLVPVHCRPPKSILLLQITSDGELKEAPRRENKKICHVALVIVSGKVK